MIVDTSAILSVLLDEAAAPRLLDAIVDDPAPRMSAANWLEVAMIVEERGGRLASQRLDAFFRTAGIEVVAVSVAQAEAAPPCLALFRPPPPGGPAGFRRLLCLCAGQAGGRAPAVHRRGVRPHGYRAGPEGFLTPMPELFIELFSEEIPARLQSRGAQELARALGEALADLSFHGERVFSGPRRIALAASVAAGTQATASVERGPRVAAPEQALAGFLRKHGAAREALRQDGDFWVLDRATAAVDAASLVAAAMPGLLRRFAWPKSMRWGAGSTFAWIRPLRRIVCLLDGAVVPFGLAQGEDDGHGLVSGNLTEGHRMHGPCIFAVTGVEDWQDKLFTHRVMVRARAGAIWHGVTQRAAEKGVVAVEDAGLLDEVAGLVEWPVPLLGRIDDAFMDLPPEVMQVSMRVNQRYFATRTQDGAPAPFFAFAANLESPDGGAAIVAGNERVLRARFADARHFWDLDRRTKLADRVAALDGVTFQAELGSQGDRVRRLVRLAGAIAPMVGADAALAERAALLCKADLTDGDGWRVSRIAGVMGGYYAVHDGEDARVAAAVGAHYAPRGPTDTVPSAPITVVVALADKLDQLAAFFSVGQQPTGSGDPFGAAPGGPWA